MAKLHVLVAVLLAACVGLVAANSDSSSGQEWAESSSWEGNVLHPFYDAAPATKITTLDTLPPIGTRARTSGSLPSVPITLNEDRLSRSLPFSARGLTMPPLLLLLVWWYFRRLRIVDLLVVHL